MFDKLGSCWVQSLITFLKRGWHNVCMRSWHYLNSPVQNCLKKSRKNCRWLHLKHKTPEFMSTFVSVISVCEADPYRKFSAVFGTTSANSSIFIRPRSWRADEKTLCEQLNTRNRDSVEERTTCTHERWVSFASGKTQQNEKTKVLSWCCRMLQLPQLDQRFEHRA